MKQFSIVICLLSLSFLSLAQNKTINISGTVLENGSNSPIEFATVLLAESNTKKAIAGTTTNENGSFKLKTKEQSFYVEVSFLGYKTKTITDFKITNNSIKLGTLILSEDAASLDEVVVQAEKSTTVFKLDKRVFNVGTDISSTGASALEVLNNVPSVNVNIEGQISLRGSTGVQILMNGKPSVLASEEGNALGTITADMIEKIEVITNPSAKYDAEGTSGIINIVLKKSEKKGLNGSVTLNTGIPNNHSVGLSLNRRTEKFNLFSQIGYGRRSFLNESDGISLDKTTNITLDTEGESDKNEKFFNLVLGTDYHINDLNVLTLSGHYAFEDELEHADNLYQLKDENSVITDAWNRNELTTATNPKYEYEFQYKKDFKNHKDRNLLLSATGTSFSKDKVSNFANDTNIGSNSNSLQLARTNFSQNEYTFKIDYTHPFAEKYTVETGMQYVIDDVANDYAVEDFIGGVWVNNANYTNIFDYNQGVLGLYTTAAYEGSLWGLKLGVRYENTDLDTELRNSNESNSRKYGNLFPSAHTSYKVSDDISLQAGYSKRILRPRLWSLNPFTSFRDNYNIRTGNPNLNPEYTDSFEITSIYKFEGGSLNFGVYHRATEDVIERVITYANNVSTSTPENIGNNNVTGVELNAKYNPSTWLTITTDMNFNTFKRRGQFQTANFDFTGERWSSELTGKFKLPANFTIEATGSYESKYQNIQQTVNDNLYMDFGARKKMLNGKLTTSLSVRDVFASRKYQSTADQLNFYRTTNSKRGRYITVGLSFGFGKGEAMEFSGQKHF